MNKPLALALVLWVGGAWPLSSRAAVTVYSDKAQWSAALTAGFQTEDFADSVLNTGVSFVSTESGHVNTAEECYQDVLASQSHNEPMTTWSFTPQVTAYGGEWTLGGPGGSGNSLLVYIADSSQYVGAISNSYGGGFWGFICDSAFSSVKLVGGSGSNQQNYRLDNMVYGIVPEPATHGLLVIAGLVLMRRRRWL